MSCSEALSSAKALLDDAIRRQPEIDAAVPAARAALDEVAGCACRGQGLADDEIVRVQAAVDGALANPGRTVHVEGAE